MQNFKDLVLITQKPLEEKRINIIDGLPYTEDEFIKQYGEEMGKSEWRGAQPRPITQSHEVDGSACASCPPGYVKIPDEWNAYKSCLKILERFELFIF